MNQSEESITQAVIASLARAPEARTRRLLERLVVHLHAFVRETEPSTDEWLAALEFLTAVGQKSDPRRQEFVLLSDSLGISTLVDAIQNRKSPGATESSLLGPFFVAGAPERAPGANIAQSQGSPLSVRGRVVSARGEPLPGATLEVWQTAATGLYDVQDPTQPQYNLRGRFRADGEGRFAFESIKPVSYPIPSDGPVGRLLALLGRHPYRPAHIHFIVAAPGHRRVVTELFDASDGYLESDVVFGVKPSLVVPFRRTSADSEPPRYSLEYEFRLEPVEP